MTTRLQSITSGILMLLSISFSLVLFLFSTQVFAQSWNDFGPVCTTVGGGQTEVKFKSNGNAISANFTNQSVIFHEWDGTNWNVLPNPVVIPSVNYFGMDLEMYQDTAYIALAGNGLRIFKWTGTSWVAVGTRIYETFGQSNYDFTIDPSGKMYVCHPGLRRIYRFQSGDWTVVHTLAQGTSPNFYGYNFLSDNSITFNTQNELHYVATYKNKQIMKKLTSTFDEVLVGDTLIHQATLGGYIPSLLNHPTHGLVGVFGATFRRPFVKRLNGNTWELFGDSSTFGMGSGFSLVAAVGNTLLFGNQGSNDKKIWACTGSNNAFYTLDLVPRTWYILTDLVVNPTDNKPYVVFGCQLTNHHSMMRYDNAITSNQPEKSGFLTASVIYPNPAFDKIHFSYSDPSFTSWMIYTLQGRLVREGKWDSQKELDIEDLGSGIYYIRLFSDQKGSKQIRFVKQ